MERTLKKQRKRYTPEEKVAILKRHLLDKEPISKLCDELGLQPTAFCRRQKEFSDNRPQFIAKDFKQSIRIWGMTHVRTSPYYPQSNGRSNAGTNR